MGTTKLRLTLALAGLVLLAACAGPEAPSPRPRPAAEPDFTPTVVPTLAPRPTAVPDPVPVSTPRSEPTVEALSRASLFTPTEPPPKVDTSVASVSLDDVVFDTFQGGFIRLSGASDTSIDRLRDAIPPIYEPAYDSVEGGGWLSETELVMGYSSATEHHAYPLSMLTIHEIVNDVIDGVPVLVSYCPLCLSGAVYSRELDGKVLLFGNTSALYESDMVMYDHQTGSYWFQVLGEAIVGPLTGKRLTLLPAVTTTWGEWKRLHPETQVLSKDLGLLAPPGVNPYAPRPMEGYRDQVDKGFFSFPVSGDKMDARLSPGTIVFAVQVGDSHKAYPISDVMDMVVNDEVGGERVVVLVREDGPAASAYLSTGDGRFLTFRLADGTLEDVETGSEWNDAGLATSGPLAGAQLPALPARTGLWFSVVRRVTRHRIPNSVGMNSEESPWVNRPTWRRKPRGTTACR